MVLPTFVRQALAGDPITVFGDGTQSRSFTYVGDVVDALVALALEPRAIGEVFNIGNRGEISIRDLAERVKTFAGSDSPMHDLQRGIVETVLHASTRGAFTRVALLIAANGRV